MSDERKELIKRLDAYFTEHLIMASQEVRDLFREVRVAIQHQPEIDDMDEYIQDKTQELIDIISKVEMEEAMSFIKGIIRDAKGRELKILGRSTKYPHTKREEEWIRIK